MVSAGCRLDPLRALYRQQARGTQADQSFAFDGRPYSIAHVADVVAAVVYMAGLPLAINVMNRTVMATNRSFVGRG